MAAWILAAAALAEVIAAGMVLVDRARHNPPLSIQVPPGGDTAEGAARPAPSFGDPFAGITASTPAPKLAAPTPAASPGLATPAASAGTQVAVAATPGSPALLPKPTPVEEVQVAGPEDRLNGLLTEARALRTKGDTSTAITRLREAATMAPKSALVMYELAKTYSQMGLDDKALEQWRAIHDMGDSAGIYYDLADAKLNAAAMPSPSAGDASSPAPGAADFKPGATLALVNLTTVEKPETSDGYKRFTLKIPIKRRADVTINAHDVAIQVFFYDELGDNSIVRTNADVSDHWSTLLTDWAQDDIQILEVDYTQVAPEPGKIEAGRHYYGYDVRLYYSKQLQDQAADPETLIKTYPAPATLPDK